jgi:hypothetical protein
MAENITYIVDNWFPQGVDNIPTELDIENKIKKGTFTVRDAILLKVYQDGITFGPEDIEINPTAVKKIKEVFVKNAPVSRFVSYTKTYKAALNKPYFDVFTGSEKGTSAQLAKLFGGKVKTSEGKKHQNIDRLVTDKYAELEIDRPRTGTVVSKQPPKATRAELGSYPPGFTMWGMITGAASDMAEAGENTAASAWLFHNLVPLRNTDLFGMTVDPEYAKSGVGGISRPLLRKIGDELQLTVVGVSGKDKKKIIKTFILTDFQKNIITPYYNRAMEQLEQKRAYIERGGTAKDYRKEFKNSNHLDGRLFVAAESRYGKIIKSYFGPKLGTYEGIITGVKGREIVRKIQGDMIGRNYDDATAALLLAQKDLDPSMRNTAVLRNFYKAQELVKNIDITKHGQTDPITYIMRKIENDIAQSLKYNDVNKIAAMSGVEIDDDTKKIAVNKNTGIADNPKIRTKTEQKNYFKEIEAASKERIAKSLKRAAEDTQAAVGTNIQTSNQIKQYAIDNNLTITEARNQLFPETRGRKVKPPLIAKKNDPLVERLAKKYNISPDKLANKSLSEMMKIVKNLKPSKKTVDIAKKIGKTGFVGGVGLLGGVHLVTDPAQAAGEEAAYGASRLGIRALGVAGGPATIGAVVASEAFAAKEAGAGSQGGAFEREMSRIADVEGPDEEGVYDLDKASALTQFGEIETQGELERGTHPRIEEERKLRDEQLNEQMFNALGGL